jgi:hypothetical protein
LPFLYPAVSTVCGCGKNRRWGRSGDPGSRWRRENLRWVDDFECLAFRSIDEFVVDEQASSERVSTGLGGWRNDGRGDLRLLVGFSVREFNLRS